MPAATMAWVVPGALGALGLYQQSQAAKKQSDAISKAQKAGKFTEASQGRMFQLAENYDPVKSADVAIGRAREVAGHTLQKNLKELRGNFVSGGGDPAGDTEFNVRAQDVTNQVMDPLRDFIAKTRAAADMQKIGAYQAVAGVPIGQISQNYWQQAAVNQPNWAGPAQLFADAIRNIGGNKSAGGSGDSGRLGSGPGPTDILNSKWLYNNG
jgi:hypothetical protein